MQAKISKQRVNEGTKILFIGYKLACFTDSIRYFSILRGMFAFFIKGNKSLCVLYNLVVIIHAITERDSTMNCLPLVKAQSQYLQLQLMQSGVGVTKSISIHSTQILARKTSYDGSNMLEFVRYTLGIMLEYTSINFGIIK